MIDETLSSGTVLHGCYRIERVLGSGGFGHVYLAVDLTNNQQYALKEYLVTGASGQEQLKHEATVLSQLHHPNLPAFRDAFIEHGRYYVVLNYIEGNDLTDLVRIARQRNDIIPIARIMEWLLAVCDAVIFLHSQRPPVIHRDIKPDNIRIMPDGTAILVDLGNAKAAADGARTLFFIRHQGTPGYAPPEQYPGGAGTDTRSDVYALAGTLYFVLTTHEPPSVSVRNESIQRGRPDLPSLQEVIASNPPEESPEANAARQFRLGVTKPSKPAPRHSHHVAQLSMLSPELLNQLNRIIQKAMAMRPRDRYQSVADIANDLKKVIGALPPQQPPNHRPVDPHSTQPDLPMLYETLQAAKENAAGESGNTSTAPMGSPSVPPPTDTCPRCNAPLMAKAAFCPQCGTPLSNNLKAKASDVSAEQTMLVGPESELQQAIAAHGTKSTSIVAKPATRPTVSRSPQAVQSTTSAARGVPARNAVSTVAPAPLRSSTQSNSANTPAQQSAMADNAPTPGFKMEPKAIALLLIVLLVVIVIIMLFVLSRGQLSR